jgi:hypothetical protein
MTDDSLQIRDDDDENPPSSSLSKHQIQEIAKSQGFFISPGQAGDFISSLDKTWLEGEFNFLAYAAEKVQKSGKPENEHVRLFVKSWEQDYCIREYPEWRENKAVEATAQEERRQQEATANEKRRELDTARENKPPCKNCGSALPAEGLRGNCPSCGFDFIFIEDTGEWEFSKPRNLSEEYRNIIQGQGKHKTDTPPDDAPVAIPDSEIEF